MCVGNLPCYISYTRRVRSSQDQTMKSGHLTFENRAIGKPEVLSPGFEKKNPGQNFKNPVRTNPDTGHEQILKKKSDKKTRTTFCSKPNIYIALSTVKFAVYVIYQLPIACKQLLLRPTASFVANINFLKYPAI